MAKKIKTDNPQEELDFQKVYAQQPEEIRQMLDEFNISSLEDLLGLAIIAGIDPDKVMDYRLKNSPNKLPTIEEVMFDDENPVGNLYRKLKDAETAEIFDDENDDEMNPFLLPSKILFEELPAQKYHLRMKLNHAPVPIWREVEVPSNISLEFFAFVVIETMGWENEHLHQFKKGNTIYQNSVCTKREQEMFGFFSPQITTLSSEDYPISAIFKEKGDRIEFEYDFGDSWYHDIWLKGISEYQPYELKEPKLLKGIGMCPPEDCGGIGGYAYLLEILSKKRKSAEEKERLNWYGIEKSYDPNDFDFDWTEDNLVCLWIDAMSE